MAWKPGQRKAERALEDPFDGVPAHLKQPLWEWVETGLDDPYLVPSRDVRVNQIALDLREPISARNGIAVFLTKVNHEDDFLLDLTEAMLERFGWDNGRAGKLGLLLTEANSAYAVNDKGNGLEERIASGVKQLVSEAVDSAGGSAGDHLISAWNEAYGRKADPEKAYSEAIKAVEAALASTIAPSNQKQTLGTMIRDVAAKPSKWKFVIADGNVGGVDTVLHMMRMLWEGQTSRHGGLNPTRAETLDEARAALHLAAALVQFGTSGALDLV